MIGKHLRYWKNGWFLLYFTLLLPACNSKIADKPNFIIIYCDDLGYGDIGPYGNKVHRTPNLDRMADGARRKDAKIRKTLGIPRQAGAFPESPQRIKSG